MGGTGNVTAGKAFDLRGYFQLKKLWRCVDGSDGSFHQINKPLDERRRKKMEYESIIY